MRSWHKRLEAGRTDIGNDLPLTQHRGRLLPSKRRPFRCAVDHFAGDRDGASLGAESVRGQLGTSPQAPGNEASPCPTPPPALPETATARRLRPGAKGEALAVLFTNPENSRRKSLSQPRGLPMFHSVGSSVGSGSSLNISLPLPSRTRCERRMREASSLQLVPLKPQWTASRRTTSSGTWSCSLDTLPSGFLPFFDGLATLRLAVTPLASPAIRSLMAVSHRAAHGTFDPR